jgi:hypothetical protein
VFAYVAGEISAPTRLISKWFTILDESDLVPVDYRQLALPSRPSGADGASAVMSTSGTSPGSTTNSYSTRPGGEPAANNKIHALTTNLPALPDFSDFYPAFRATQNNHPGLGGGAVGMGQQGGCAVEVAPDQLLRRGCVSRGDRR